MRTLTISLGLGLVFLTGCNLLPFRTNSDTHSHVAPTDPPPSAETLVNYLNDNSSRVQAVRCPGVELTTSGVIRGAFSVKGNLACDKPRNFRLKGSFLGTDRVDVGSNSKEFWFWVNEGGSETPVVAHCSYDDLETKQVNLPFPFQPEMLVTALGMGTYDPRANYDVKRNKDGNIEMVETVVAPSGKTLKKMTLFFGDQVRAPRPQVLAHKLFDEKGTLLCEAVIEETTLDTATNAVLPTRMSVRMPQDKDRMVLTLSMKKIQSAVIKPEDAGMLFTRRSLQNYPGYDLATGRREAPGGLGQLNSLQQTGARATQRDDGWGN